MKTPRKTSTLVSKTASLITMAVGSLVLAGWVFNISSFKTILPEFGNMKFNTAVCFIIAGFTLYLLNNTTINSPTRKIIVQVCSWLILLAGILSLSYYIFGWRLNFDMFLWEGGPKAIANSNLGQMSLIVSFNFTLLGLIFLMLGKRKYHWLIQTLVIAMIPGSLLVVMNHLFGISFLNSIPLRAPTALHTALLFIILSFGIFFSSALGYLQISFIKKVTGFFVLVFLVRSIIFFALDKNNEQTFISDKWAAHTHEVLFMGEQINAQTNEMQSSARGYIITDEDNYLPLINNSADTIHNIIGRLRTITKDDAGQILLIDSLEKHVNNHITFLTELVNIRRNEGFDAAQKYMLNGQGKILINEIEAIVTTVEHNENQLLAKRLADNELSIKNTSKLLTLFQVIAGLLMLGVLIMIYKEQWKRNKAEAALKKSLKDISDYKYALDVSSIVVITDQNGIIKKVNDNFCRITKYTREELIGQDHRIFNSGYHTKEFIRDLWITINNGEVWRGEIKNKAKDGTYFWLYSTIVPFMDERGTPYQYVAIRSDITQRKKLEGEIILFNQDLEQKVNERTEELSNREKQLASIFDTVADSIFVLEVKNKTDFLFTSVNPAFLLTSGLEYDQVVGKRMNDILPETSLNHVMEKCKKAIETKKIVSWEETSDYPSGRLTGAVSIAPIFDESGNCIKIIGSIHDLTERKKAEKALIESENYLRTIVETEPECVKLIDINGELQSMNPAGLAMIEADNLEQVKGKSILGIIDSSYKEAFKKLTQNIFKGKSGKMEFEITGLKGTHRWLETHAVPLKNAEGKIISLLGVTRDITERKKAEDELKKYAEELEISNKELEHFAYAASHDLQEPLRMVSSFLNLVEKRIDVHLDDTTRQYINFASDGAERMKRLIQDLLQYSRVGRNKENFASIDLNEVVQYVTHVLDEKIKKNSALITRKTLPVITANKTLITHLFVNLVNNALKYHNGKQTKIEIGSIEEPVNHILYVKDNGIGIDPKFFEMIFIIFKRLHTKKEYSGTGIGLAISKKIVEIHKGKIWVESEPGKGSTFYFSIPKIDQ